jgi:hypothetical protein
MKHGCKHISALITLLLACSALHAQVKVRAVTSRENILIGEPIQLTVEAYVPLGSRIGWFPADTIPGFEIMESSGVDTAESIDGKKISQALLLTSFDSGQLYIPPFGIMINEEVFYTDSIPVTVSYTPFDPNADYRDIKDIIDSVNPSLAYVPWVLGGIGFIALLATALLLIMSSRKPLQEIVVEKPFMSPYDEAMKSLNELQKPQNPTEIKAFYSKMNDILRNYVSARFHVSTFERTNDELILQLYDLSLQREAFSNLSQSLRMTDFVKFAKYLPSDEDNENNLNSVRTSIDMLDKRFASVV